MVYKENKESPATALDEVKESVTLLPLSSSSSLSSESENSGGLIALPVLAVVVVVAATAVACGAGVTEDAVAVVAVGTETVVEVAPGTEALLAGNGRDGSVTVEKEEGFLDGVVVVVVVVLWSVLLAPFASGESMLYDDEAENEDEKDEEQQVDAVAAVGVGETMVEASHKLLLLPNSPLGIKVPPLTTVLLERCCRRSLVGH